MSNKDFAPKLYPFDGKAVETSPHIHSFKAGYATKNPTYHLPVVVSEWKGGNAAVTNGDVKHYTPTHAKIEIALRTDVKGVEYVDVFYLEHMKNGADRRHLLGGADVALMRKEAWAKLQEVKGKDESDSDPMPSKEDSKFKKDNAKTDAERSKKTAGHTSKASTGDEKPPESIRKKLESLATDGAASDTKEPTTPTKTDKTELDAKDKKTPTKTNKSELDAEAKEFTPAATSSAVSTTATIPGTPKWDGSGLTGFAWSPALKKQGGGFLKKSKGASKELTSELTEPAFGESARHSQKDPNEDEVAVEDDPTVPSSWGA
ncbi:MAG: hypothetical protein M1831_005649 [Alyxoria varia]|nr:MAG: hypothetical protein M1831_005649 [Alyxoria varia]